MEPLPDPVPVATGAVVVVPSSVRIKLYGSHGVYDGGIVPVGRYELYADFGYGLSNIGRLVDVVEGYETTLHCNTLRHTCDVDR